MTRNAFADTLVVAVLAVAACSSPPAPPPEQSLIDGLWHGSVGADDFIYDLSFESIEVGFWHNSYVGTLVFDGIAAPVEDRWRSGPHSSSRATVFGSPVVSAAPVSGSIHQGPFIGLFCCTASAISAS